MVVGVLMCVCVCGGGGGGLKEDKIMQGSNGA